MSGETKVFYLTRLSIAEVIQRRWQTNETWLWSTGGM